MTDTSSHGENQDPNATLEALIRVLQDDVKLRTTLFDQLGQLIGSNINLLQAHSEHSSDLERRFSIEEKRSSRAKWYTGILGVFAMLIGAVLFYLVFMMARDMDRMEDYMYNMGHASGDERKKPFEFKQPGSSYMMSMAEDMQTMRSDMAKMRNDMGQMRQSMSNMDGNMGAMAGDMGSMSNDMTVMNGTMGRMQHDTLWMRQGVGSMASDTNQMGTPFRWMNSMTPW